MRNLLLAAVILLLAPVCAPAQSVKNVLRPSNLTKVVNVISDHLSDLELTGTWIYAGSSVQFESESLLKKAGGAVAANAAEKNLDEQLEKLGFGPGVTEFVFKENGKFTHTLSDRTLTGTYTYDASTGYMVLKYLRLMPVRAKVMGGSRSISLLFETNKFLTLVTFLGGHSGSGAIKAITSIAGSYDGMLMGFELVKR